MNPETVRQHFGTWSNAARKIGVPLTTCHGWKRRGHVPDWRVPAIRAAMADDKKCAARSQVDYNFLSDGWKQSRQDVELKKRAPVVWIARAFRRGAEPRARLSFERIRFLSCAFAP
jgi:hypothetical protein